MVSDIYSFQGNSVKSYCLHISVSDPPSNLQVDNMLITSRNFTVLWDEPNNTYSLENYGYVIQVRLGEQCIKEVVYRCIDCRPESRVSICCHFSLTCRK